MTIRLTAPIVILLLGCPLAAARPPDSCSLTSTVTDAKLTLSISDGRTSFREGEIIPLVLSFTSTADKRYRAVARDYDRSGRLDLDSYCLEPEARDPLADYFSTTLSMGGGLGGYELLNEKPFSANTELNEWRQPEPGHYRLYVVSPRVSLDSNSLNPLGTGVETVTLRSNTIEFDVIKADPKTRAKQLQEATEAYNPTAVPCDSRLRQECVVGRAARRLRFLNTKESTETLARLFWSLNDQPGGWDLMFGLYGSPYRAEAIAAMQREINAADQPITQDFLMVFTKLQLLQSAGEVPKEPSVDDPAALRKFFGRLQKIHAHEPEVRRAALTDTVAALPHKTARAHALTLVTLATEKSDLLDMKTVAQIRRQLIAEWNTLPEKTRAALIQTGWPPLDGTEALPILREIVSQPPPHFGNAGGFACYALTQDQCGIVQSRNKALKHIFELDPAEGRSLILRDLSDPEAQSSLSLLKSLSAAQLRPFVQRAAQRIASARQVRPPGLEDKVPTHGTEPSDARLWDYFFVEQFADKSELEPLEARFKGDDEHLHQPRCIPYAEPLLSYFLRVDPLFGAREVQSALDARKGALCNPRLLEELGPSLPKVEQLAISALDDSDSDVSASAARALGRWGTAKAETALWARLKRFQQEWHDRESQLNTATDPRDPISRATVLQGALLASIVSGTNWICGPEKLTRLRTMVGSQQERMNLSHWIDQWDGFEGPWILTPFWDPDDKLTFSVLQYSQFDEEQIRLKLSQLPRGSKLYFQTYTAEQMGSPVSMEKQQAVLRELRKYAAQFGVIIEERPPYNGAS
jgi:hypothetical protein